MIQTVTLESATRDFFRLYWNESHIGEPPQWNTWNLVGEPAEAKKGGCYAIYRAETLLYIGVAVTEGKNAAKTGKKYGLLNRLMRHVIRRKGRGSTEFVPYEKKEQWKGLTRIHLIGFPDDHRHLAAALEAYLIRKLPTVVNAQSRWLQSDGRD